MFYKINIFEKNGNYAFLSIDYEENRDVIANFDGRIQKGFIQYHDNPILADERYLQAMKTTLERGWSLKYNGERNWG